MNDTWYLIFAFAVGMALGAFFSLNLWTTVRKMTDEQTPWHIMYGNFVLRMSAVVIGFYLVMAGRWERMIATLLGFVVMREILVRYLGRKPEEP
jgi:F1F0 ATPase subunit 2